MTESPVEAVLLESVARIEALGIPYAVMGGFAARAWGLPRPTFDVDIAVAADAARMQDLFGAFEGAGFDVPPEYRKGFLDTLGGFEKARVTYFADGHAWTTDLFLATGPFLTSALGRARVAKFAGRSVRVMAPEDIILLKLIANRRKDLADVEDIVAICGDLDLGYLRAWAARLGLVDRLREFLPE